MRACEVFLGLCPCGIKPSFPQTTWEPPVKPWHFSLASSICSARIRGGSLIKGEMAESAGTFEPPLLRFGEQPMDSPSILQEDPAPAKGAPLTAWSALTELHSWLLGLSLFLLAPSSSKGFGLLQMLCGSCHAPSEPLAQPQLLLLVFHTRPFNLLGNVRDGDSFMSSIKSAFLPTSDFSHSPKDVPRAE